MRQAVLTEPRKFQIREVDKPVPGEHEALIRVHAIGVCGTDIHAYHGRHPFISCPIVIGHEAAGEVVEAGSGVRDIKIGDRVVLRPQEYCGECLPCREGRYNICNALRVNGCQFTGASSDYYAMDAGLLYRLPDNVGYGAGTVIEPLAVGVHAVKRAAKDVTGKKVLVTGAGTIGNVVAQSAKAMGAKEVMITDIAPFKLEIARQCGIDHAVNVREQNLASAMKEKFGPDGADVAFECTAGEDVLNELLDISRKGITIAIVGVYGSKVSVNMANVQDREYSLVGTLMYRHEDYLDAIRFAERGAVDLNALISHEFSFNDIAGAYEAIDNNRDTMQKVIINVD
jgi:L-iditol 2-dehydrogenase